MSEKYENKLMKEIQKVEQEYRRARRMFNIGSGITASIKGIAGGLFAIAGYELQKKTPEIVDALLKLMPWSIGSEPGLTSMAYIGSLLCYGGAAYFFGTAGRDIIRVSQNKIYFAEFQLMRLYNEMLRGEIKREMARPKENDFYHS